MSIIEVCNHLGRPNTYEWVLWGTPKPNTIGLIWYSLTIMFPITKFSQSYMNGRSCRISYLLGQCTLGSRESCFPFCASEDFCWLFWWPTSPSWLPSSITSSGSLSCGARFCCLARDDTRDPRLSWGNLPWNNPGSHNFCSRCLGQLSFEKEARHRHRLFWIWWLWTKNP